MKTTNSSSELPTNSVSKYSAIKPKTQRTQKLPDWLNKPCLCALAVSLGVSSFAYGQQSPNIEEISITGTRIIRSGVDTPTPVTTVTATELNRAAPGNLIESLTTLPQFFGNITPEVVTGGQNSGGSNVNLRGAGVNRTLVLLDGRRVVPSNRFGTVDVSVFPETLIQRVETITGGASASYGTDAVAGVVNFILDTGFEGFKAHSQLGTTTHGDGDTYEVGFAFGHQFDNGLHVLVAAETFEQDRINSFGSLQDRDYFVQRARITNPDPNGPAEIIRPYVSPTNYTNGGLINQPGSSLHKTEFLPDGSFQTLPFSGIGQLDGGCNCQAESSQSYGVDGDNEVAPGYDRDSIFLRAGYDISPDFNVYGQFMYGNTVVADRRESIALLGPWAARVYADNVLLPAEIRQTMADEGLESVGLGFFARNSADTPLGESFHETDNEFTSTTIGFDMRLQEGGFFGGWNVSGYYDYGENVQDFIANNSVRVDRMPMALDAVDDGNGNAVCRVTLFNPGVFDDCVPLNLYGGVENIDPAARAFVMDDGKVARQWTKQHVAELVLTGEVWEGLEAGPVFGAFGGSYRKQELEQRTLDPSDEFPATTDGTLLSDLGLMDAGLRGVVPESEGGVPGLRHVPPGFKGDANSSSVLFTSLREISGDFDVKELFGELNIPLLSGRDYAQSLELDLATRWAEYEGSGSIWAWKMGISWQIVDDLRLRATQSRDVRAATLQERFDQTRGGASVTDPENNNATINTASFSGGNENVSPEEADTVTIGAVYQPSFLEGFSVSLDWYDIDVKDAIAQLSSQNVVDGCFNGDAALCEFVIRDSSNQIVRVDNLFINLANQRISGVDMEMNYSTPVSFVGGDESLTWRFFATWLNENSIQNPDAARDERVGQLGGGFSLPEYKFTTNVSYDNGPVSVFVQGRWLDSGLLDRFRTQGVDIDDNTVSSVFYTDLNISYTRDSSDGGLGWEAFFNVTNLFDRDPPPVPGTVGRTGTNEVNAALHDVLGRRYVAGVRVNF